MLEVTRPAPNRFAHRFTVLIAAVLAGTAGTAALPQSAAGAARPSEWPQNGYGPARVWYNPNETTLSVSNVGSITTKYDVTKADADISSEVMGGGMRYMAVANGIQAVDASSGRPTWFAAGPYHHALVYDRGTVFALSDYPTGLTAYDAVTGALSWQAPSVTAGDYFSGNDMAARNGLLYVFSEYYAGPEYLHAYLTGVDEGTGTKLWVRSWYPGDDWDFGFAVTGTALVTPAQRARSGGLARVAVRDPMSGNVIWSKTLPTHEPIEAISIQSNVAYVAVYGAILALDLTTHTVRTVIAPSTTPEFTMAFVASTMYVTEDPGAPPWGHKIAAIDLLTGKVRWTHTYSGGATWIHLAVANGVVYSVFIPMLGAEKLMAWRADTGRQVLARPLSVGADRLEVAGGRVNLSARAEFCSYGLSRMQG